MDRQAKILVLGAKGFVGSAIVRELRNQGYSNVLESSRDKVNLLMQSDVLNYFRTHQPEYVFMSAAKVGGVYANNIYRADFISENLAIQSNTFQAAFESGVRKFLFMGSACAYPREAPQPIREEYLLTGPLEPTNEPYAVAKIAGVKLAESYRRQYNKNFFSVMPTNLYGANDNFSHMNSHVVPGLIARMKEVIDLGSSIFSVWGSGQQRREFLSVDDLATACIHLMQLNQEVPHYVNIGTGIDISIQELAELIADVLGYRGQLKYDTSQPEGVSKRLLDTSLIQSLGWKPRKSLRKGIEETVKFYLERLANKPAVINSDITLSHTFLK